MIFKRKLQLSGHLRGAVVSKDMKKILFCIPSMVGGGAERVFVYLMNGIDRGRFSVELALLRKEGRFLGDLAGDIEVHELRTDLAGSFFRLPGVIDEVEPDVVIGTICYMNLMLGFSRAMVRKARPAYIGRESGIPSLRGAVARSFWNAKWLYKISYRRLDRIVCQSADMRNDVTRHYGVPLGKIVTINNPADAGAILEKASQGRPVCFDKSGINVVAMGRLHRQKGFDMLLRAMERVKDKTVHLHLLGDGEQAGELAARAKRAGIDDRVTFHGFVSNPYPYLREAEAFILSSRYEGFPNVLVEAMILGCPVVAFNCPGGINELVEEGRNGHVVPLGDIDALASALDRVATFRFDRREIAAAARERFDIGKVVPLYERLFEEPDRVDF